MVLLSPEERNYLLTTPTAQNTPPEFTNFNDRLRYQTRGLTHWLGQQGLKLHLHPDTITIFGLVVVGIAALLAAGGWFFASGIVFLLATPLDALDGAIAREMNRTNRFGKLLDSTLDRYADGFMFFGIAYYYAASGQMPVMAVAVAALIGAYLVSYVRARAEGLGIGSIIKDGVFDRLTRIVILIIMLLTGWVIPGLVILAIGSHLTALQRILIVYRATRDDGI